LALLFQIVNSIKMFRRDYLKKQIDELGKTLGKILELLGGKNNGSLQDLEQTVERQLSGKVDLSLTDFIEAQKAGTLEVLISNKSLTTDHIEQFAEVFYRLGKTDSQELGTSIIYLKTSLELFDYLNRINAIYSLEIEYKIVEIENLIESKN
jgi:hypothetical protein